MSYYFYLDTTGWANCNKIHNFNSFDKFIEGYLNSNINWHYPIMHKHIFGQLYDESRLVVKRENILRLETINKDLINFKERYNLDIITDLDKKTAKEEVAAEVIKVDTAPVIDFEEL